MSREARGALRLRDIERCLVGAIPASIATCSPDGIPNVTNLSIVHPVDDDHLALSFQFFRKTRENLLGNPRAQLLVPDPATMEQYRIDVCYERTETEGPVFDRMRTNLEAIASQMGATDVFHLKGADVLRVLGIERLAHDLDLSPPDAATNHLAALELLSQRMAECDELEELLDTTLDGLAELFGYAHTMVLLADDRGERLFAIASRGFPTSGIGAEVAIGEGLLGHAAKERRVVSVASMHLQKTMASAVRGQSRAGSPTGEIPLPGLADAQCQIAAPILSRDRVLGVLSVQSPLPGGLLRADEQAIGTLARYLATSLQLLERSPSREATGQPPPSSTQPQARPLRVRFHPSDDSIFVDEAYLIKGLSGRILHRLLAIYLRDGRCDFSNKELRVDDSLQLGAYRDNLEARLLLLRRRLEEQRCGLRIDKTGRGRFRLVVERPVEILRLASF